MIYIHEDIETIIHKISKENITTTLSWADELASGYYTHKAHYEMERCTKRVKINDDRWNVIPEGMKDPEWNFALARLSSLLCLSKAYAYSKDEKYLASYNSILSSFYNFSNRNGLSWRSLEAGIRCENLIRSFEILSLLRVDTANIKAIVDKLLLEQIEILKNTHKAFHRLSNWGVMQDHGLFIASLYLDDKEGLELSLKRLSEEAVFQTLPCGTHWEQSPMYQCEVLHSFLDTILVAKRHNISVPKSLTEKAHLMATSLMAQTSVTGYCFATGDTDEINPNDLLSLASYLFNDQELSKGENEENIWDSIKPFGKINNGRRSSFMLPDGHLTIRTKVLEAHMFTGNLGSGHGHISPLHVDIAGKTKPFFIDLGRYTYLDCEEREFFKKAEQHNVPILEKEYPIIPIGSWGYNRVGETTRGECFCSDGYEMMSAINLTLKDEGFIIKRNVIKVSEEIIAIIDQYSVSGNQKANVRFHLHPDCQLENKEDSLKIINGNEDLYILTNGEIKLSKTKASLHYNEECETNLICINKDIDKSGSVITIISSNPISFKELETRLIDSNMVLSEKEAKSFLFCDQNNEWTIVSRQNEVVSQVDVIKAGSLEGYGRLIIKEKSAEFASTLYY